MIGRSATFIACALACVGCFESHEGTASGDAGSGPLTCSSPERCDVWVEVSWRASLAPGTIDRLVHRTNMACYDGIVRDDTTVIGPAVDPRLPSMLSRYNVCSGCFLYEIRALGADGRELARGRREFCAPDQTSIVVPLF